MASAVASGPSKTCATIPTNGIAGATVFLAPAENAADARSVAHGITVVSVRTYQDAVNYLNSHR